MYNTMVWTGFSQSGLNGLVNWCRRKHLDFIRLYGRRSVISIKASKASYQALRQQSPLYPTARVDSKIPFLL